MSSSQSTTSIPNSTSPSLSNISTATGLSAVAESTHPHHRNHHLTRVRDTNKLTSESSSLNFKQPTSHEHIARSPTRKSKSKEPIRMREMLLELNESNREGGGDSGRGSLNSTDTCMFLLQIVSSVSFFVEVVADGSEKSTSTINDGFSSVRVRNRPPLPQSTPSNFPPLQSFPTTSSALPSFSSRSPR